MAKKLFVALEEMETEEVVDMSEEEIEEAHAQAEEANTEVEESGSEIEEMGETIEDAETDVGTLTDIRDTMEESIEGEGEGMSETAVEIAEVAVEAIYARLGFPKRERILPAMESFGSTSSRREATRLAIEEVSDKIKAAGAAIVKFVKAILEKIALFFANIRKNVPALKKQNDANMKTLQSLKQNEPKEGKLSSKLVGTVLGGGSEATSDQVKKSITDTIDLAGEISDLPAKLLEAAQKAKTEETGLMDKVTAGLGKFKDKVVAGLKFGKGEDGAPSVEKATEGQDEFTAPTRDSLIAICTLNGKLITQLGEMKDFEKVKKEILAALGRESSPVNPEAPGKGAEDEFKKVVKFIQTDLSKLVAGGFKVAYTANKYVSMGTSNLQAKK